MVRLILPLVFIFSQIMAISQTELEVVEVTQSECDMHADISRIQPRIVSQRMRNDTFEITIGTIANCVGIFYPSAYLSNNTLNINYLEGWERDTIIKGNDTIIVEADEVGLCDCCFEFCFKIIGLPYQPCSIKVRGKEFLYYPDKYKIYPIQYEVLNGDTINYLDKYGLKQGHWNKIYKDERFHWYSFADSVYFDAYYIDDKVQKAWLKLFHKGWQQVSIIKPNVSELREENYYKSGLLSSLKIDNDSIGSKYYASFYENGSVQSIWLNSRDFNEQLKFYDNGQIEKITGTEIFYKLYYPNGVLKYERFYPGKNHIWAKYYYDDGTLMSIYYIKEYRDRMNFKKSWQKYFDKNGKRVTKEFLIQQGYKEVLDL